MLKHFFIAVSSLIAAVIMVFAVLVTLKTACSSEQRFSKSPVADFSLRVAEPNKIEGNYYTHDGDWLHKFLCDIKLGEFVVTFLTLFLVAFTGFLWWSTKELSKATANAAEAQAKDTRIIQRAYLSVESLGIHPLIQSDKLVAHVKIINAGNLPASKVKWKIKCLFDDDGRRKTFLVEESELEGDNVVTARSEMVQGNDDLISLAQMLKQKDAILRGKKEGAYLYVYGLVHYEDGFGEKRNTCFCHRYTCAIFDGKPHQIPADKARQHRYGNS